MRCPDCSAPLTEGAFACDNCGLPLDGSVSLDGDAPLESLPLPPEHARTTATRRDPQGYIKPSHGRRFGAALVDGVVLYGTLFLITMIVSASAGVAIETVPSEELSLATSGILIVLGLGFMVGPTIYGTVFEASRLRGTLGKRLVGLEVRDATGRPLSLGKAFVRNLVKTLVGQLFWPLILIVLVTKYRQGLHDLAARTFVVEV